MKQLPAWVRWIATDASGWTYGYLYRPGIGDGEWYPTGGDRARRVHEVIKRKKPKDWMKTLKRVER